MCLFHACVGTLNSSPLQTFLCWYNLILTTFLFRVYILIRVWDLRGDWRKRVSLFTVPVNGNRQPPPQLVNSEVPARSCCIHYLYGSSIDEMCNRVLVLKKKRENGSNVDGMPVLMRRKMVFLAGRILQRSSSFQLILYLPYKHCVLSLPYRSLYIQRSRLCG